MRLTVAHRQARPRNAPPLAAIRSLHYSLPVLDEFSDPRLDPAYLGYLRHRLTRPGPGRPADAASHR